MTLPAKLCPLPLTVLLVLAWTGSWVQAGDLWQRLGAVGEQARKYDHTMRSADLLAVRAAELYNQQDRRTAQINALKAADLYELAIRLDPRSAEPHLRAAEVLNAHFIERNTANPPPRPTKRAIAHWDKFIELAPDDPRIAAESGRPEMGILFRRSLAYTKLGGQDGFRHAIADYERLLALTDTSSVEPGEVALIMTHAAATCMGLGQLDRALELYSQALEHEPQSTYAFGLAVALDRNGQATRARQIMAGYKFSHDALFPRNQQTGQVTTFYVPYGDEFWYLGLGSEAAGKLESARNFYKQYLRFQPDSPYAELAKRHIQRLEAKLGRRSSG